MQQLDIISTVLDQNNISVSSQQLEQLSKFYDLVVYYNQQFNLTSITEIKEFACKHFADSLLNYDYYKSNSSLCDIGTGGGFPGIPLKIMRPDLDITLVDSLQKRVNFLNTAISELGLTNIRAIHSRAQELPQQNVSRETFDYVISRAVAQLNILTELCLPFVKISGEMIAFKSLTTTDELNNAQNAIAVLGGDVLNIDSFNLKSFDNGIYQRNLIHIRKVFPTDSRYPRQKNKIIQKPL